MGSCLSSPTSEQGQTRGDPDNNAPQSGTSRRQDRIRERTSLERRNTEARDQLIAGRGGKPHEKSIINNVDAPKYKRHGSWVASPPVTKSELEHARKAFWETADTFGGKTDVWQTLRAAIDCDNIDTAQALLDEAQLRLLGNGDLINGCYDATGFFYKIPQNCLSEPSNLLPDEKGASTFENKPTNTIEEFPGSELLDLKVRMSHNSQDIIVRVALMEKITSVATKIQSTSGVKKLKLMILGRMLKDDGAQTLQDAGWTPGLIVQCLVTQP